MSAKTKIMVVKMRELIYTIIFLALIILLVILLVFMFTSRSEKQTSPVPDSEQTTTEADTAPYIAGIYTTPITLGDSSVDVEVTVDENHINAIRLVNLSETTTAMYPLVSPSLEELATQIIQKQSLENITCPDNNKYTAQILLNAIAQALSNARVNNWQ